jgi:hypothetical protein
MQLSIGLLDKSYPEFVGVSAMPIERSFGLCVVGDACVDNNILPTAVLEKLEDSKTIL